MHNGNMFLCTMKSFLCCPQNADNIKRNIYNRQAQMFTDLPIVYDLMNSLGLNIVETFAPM